MNLNIDYDEKKNISYGYKIIGKETNYYLGISKICPKCKHTIIGYPALSREDNKTEICSNCGTMEAIKDFLKYKVGIEWKEKN